MDHAERIDELEARLHHEVATRERLEKELQENESRYRMTIQTARERGGRYQALVRALPDAMFSLNSEGVYLDYIPAKGFETLYPPEEFLGKSVHEIMPSDIAEASMHFIKEALRTNELQRFEYDLSMGGEWLHFEAFMVPEENEADSVWALVRDITARKQTEEKLRTTQEYLDTILLNLPVGIAILEGPEFRYYRINHRLAEINGLPVEDHLDRPLAAVLPAAAPDIIPGLRHVLETGEPRLDREFSTRLPKDPEVIRHFIDSFFPIKGADGKPRAVGAVVLDITARKQAEEALERAYAELEQRVRERTAELTQTNAVLQREIAEREQAVTALTRSERELRLMADALPVLIAFVDNNQRYRFYNAAYASMVSLAPEDLHGRTVEEVLGKETYAKILPHIEAALSGQAVTFDEQLIFPNGQTRHIHAILAPHQDESGQMLGFYALVQDITARKLAEIKIHDSEARLAGIIDIAGDAIISIDEHQQILLFNKGAEAIFGYAADEIIGQPLDVLIPERFHAAHRDHIAAFGDSATSARWMGERQGIYGRRKNGEEFPAEAAISKLKTEGTHIFTVILRDVTKKVQAEETLRQQRDELAHVQRTTMMGELTAALAHEINQPLTAIRSNAQAAKRFMNTDTPDLDEIGEILDDIIDDDRRAAEVIIRLRALLKKQTITTEPLDINAVVGEVTGLLHSDAVIKNVAVELDLAEDLPPVLGDRVQLQQVLLNLMMNGFDAMEGVPIPERILVIRTAQEAGSLVRVSVRDAGVGFDGQDVEELFTPFKTTKAKGLGMGLAINRSIVEAHGGKIWAERNADRGATFHFTLPVDTSA